jgi:hypothetical protein
MKSRYKLYKQEKNVKLVNNGNVRIVVLADCRGEWAVRLPYAPPRGKPAPPLADEARSAPDLTPHHIKNQNIKTNLN